MQHIAPRTTSRASQKPETVGQAVGWDRKYIAYVSAGFCVVDAAQASWGHQIGFANVAPIRACCRGRSLPESVSGERVASWVSGSLPDTSSKAAGTGNRPSRTEK